MRGDVVEASTVVDHPPDRVWQVVGRPERYPRFVAEIGSCEMERSADAGTGPRCLVRLCPDRDTVRCAHIHAVVYRAGEHIVWSPVADDRRWLSVELRPLSGRRTRIVVQLLLPAVDPPTARSRVTEVGTLIDQHLAGRPPGPAAGYGRHQRADDRPGALSVAATLVRAGVLSAARPDRLARQVSALNRWGATVPGGYQAAAARDPDEPALRDEQGTRTFGAAAERSTRLANALAAGGVHAGDRIALLCRNHAAMVESIIAGGKLGADVVLLNTGLSVAAVADVITEHRPAAVLADDEFTPVVHTVPGRFLRISTWPDSATGYPTVDELIAAAPDTRVRPVAQPGRIVVLTSGTTGTPKGARRPTPRGLGTAVALLARIPLRAGKRIFVAAPPFHTWGLAAMQLGMPLRATLSLTRRFDAEQTLRVMAEHRCTALFAVPIMLQRILDLPAAVRERYDLSALRVVASSGSALPGAFVTEFIDTFGDILYNLYGSTEVSWASIADPVDLRAAPTTAGRCPPGTTVALLDDTGTDVPPGTDGHIFVGNEMLFDGYTDGGSLPRAHQLMASGDRGYLDAAGRLFVTGRDDEMIVSGGENVFPRPVEEALIRLPQVHDVAVVGVPDHEYGQRLAAFLVLRRGAALDADSVRDYIHRRLARFAVPRDVFFVPRLPRNATGKVLKRLLYEEAFS